MSSWSCVSAPLTIRNELQTQDDKSLQGMVGRCGDPWTSSYQAGAGQTSARRCMLVFGAGMTLNPVDVNGHRSGQEERHDESES